MMTVKNSAIALLAVTGASMGAYTLYENKSANTESAAPAVHSVARELKQVALNSNVEERQLQPCIDFGSCCGPVVPERRGLRSFEQAMEAAPLPSVAHRDLQSCETAYSIWDPSNPDGTDSHCFIEEGVANRWGWRLELDGTALNTQEFIVAAGVGLCDWPDKGARVGTVSVTYDPANGGSCSGTFTADSGVTINEFQMYCGSAPYPLQGNKPTVASGQFPCKKTGLDGATSSTCDVGGLGTNHAVINVITHFVACGSGVPPAPTPSPPPGFCEDDAEASCTTPNDFCTNRGYFLCGDSCCNGGGVVDTVETICEAGGSDWCPNDCGDDGAVFGDPHFRTWHHNHEFEYHGECDMVFLKAPKMDMDVHVRTTIRYDYSFVSQAAVRIGGETFEVASWGEYALDGMSSVDLPAFIGGFPITKHAADDNSKAQFVIHLSDDQDIRISSYKDYVSVRIDNGTMAMYEGATGIMGDYETGSMFMRDGSIEMDPSKYAPEWQVQPAVDGVLFAAERAPVYPAKCVMPSANAIGARDRKLGEASISREQAQQACAGRSAEDQASCIEDVIKTQDLDIANAI